jgi:CRISPR-associated protein Csb2
MLAIGIRYLMDWAMAAADGAIKERAEWPPHPDRVYQALAAAWFETGQEERSGRALRWLESQAPPRIRATEYEQRRAVTSYVPVNDEKPSPAKTAAIARSSAPGLKKLKEAGLVLLPEHRTRQARGFPVAIPHDPVVHMVWEESPERGLLEALETLCDRVTSIGHSASLVQLWIEPTPAACSLEPVEGPARHRLRVPASGRLDDLERCLSLRAAIEFADQTAAIDAAKGKARKALQQRKTELFPAGEPASRRPTPARWCGYDLIRPQAPAPAAGTVFDPRLIPLRLVGARLDAVTAPRLCAALRNTLMADCAEPLPEWLTGHRSDGSPSRQPHLACVPLPSTGHEHADGHLLGIALAMPRAVVADECGRVLGDWLHDDIGLARRHRLFDGRWFSCELHLEDRHNPPWNLRSEAWTSPARRWATVAPVALNRHGDKGTFWEDAALDIAESCVHVGLPRPRSVQVQAAPFVKGAPHAKNYPPLMRRSGGTAAHVHALLHFEQPVEGPLLLGAGRYRGYGLCRPFHDPDELETRR